MMSKLVSHPFLAVLLPIVLASASVHSAHAQPAPGDAPEDPYASEDDDTAQDQQDQQDVAPQEAPAPPTDIWSSNTTWSRPMNASRTFGGRIASLVPAQLSSILSRL